MKVLLVNNVYKVGSTGTIVHEIRTELENRSEKCIVAYGRGKSIHEKNTYKFCREAEAKLHALITRLGGLQYGGNFVPTLRLIKLLKKESPDIVHIHCANGYCLNLYRFFSFLAAHNFKTIVTHHSEFYYTGNCGHAFSCYKFTHQIKGCGNCPQRRDATQTLWRDNTRESWTKFKKVFAKFSKQNLVFTSVSPWVRDRAAISPIVCEYDNHVILNGVRTDIFHFDNIPSAIDNWPTDGRPVILHVTASFSEKSKNKGGDYVIQLAKMLPDYHFVIVAAYDDMSQSLPSNIHFWGKAKNQNQLASLYLKANLTLLTSRRETFSMVCAESLCCGTPVVGFKAGGPEMISLPDYSSWVEYGDVKSLKEQVESMINQSVNKEVISQKAILRYDSKIMASNYINLYKSLLV